MAPIGRSSLGHNLSQVARSSVQLPENLQSAVEIRSAHRLLRFNPIFSSPPLSLFLSWVATTHLPLLCHCLEDKWGRTGDVYARPENFISVFNDYPPFPPAVRRSLYIYSFYFSSIRNLGSVRVIKFVRFISLDLDVRFVPSRNLPPRWKINNCSMEEFFSFFLSIRCSLHILWFSFLFHFWNFGIKKRTRRIE